MLRVTWEDKDTPGWSIGAHRAHETPCSAPTAPRCARQKQPTSRWGQLSQAREVPPHPCAHLDVSVRGDHIGQALDRTHQEGAVVGEDLQGESVQCVKQDPR